MKKLFIILLVLSLVLVCGCGNTNTDDNPTMNVSNITLTPEDISEVSSEDSSTNSSADSSISSEAVSSEEPSSAVSSTPDYSYTTSAPETYDGDWNLILVNSKNLLPEDFTVTIENVGKWPMDKRIVSIVKQMIADAKLDGVDLMICSSYRDVEKQTYLFNNQIQEFLNDGYNAEDARTEAAKWVAVPRTSEHHTGLALDIVTPTYQMLDFGFEKTDAFEWLYTHCTEYGFILRYPKDKTDITGIVYEPWHYRYVGVEAAKYIHENGLCLEEYLEQ